MQKYLALWSCERNAWICCKIPEYSESCGPMRQYASKGLNLHVLATKQTGPLEPPRHMTSWRCPAVTAVITSEVSCAQAKVNGFFITLTCFKQLPVCCNTEPSLETFSGAGLYIEWVFLSSSSYCHLRVSSSLSPCSLLWFPVTMLRAFSW